LNTEIQTGRAGDIVDKLKFPLPPARPNGREASAQVILTWAVADDKAHWALRNNLFNEPLMAGILKTAFDKSGNRR
jgi:hypothetical protein